MEKIKFPKIAQPAIRALHSIDITYLEQLSTVTKEELLALHGMGKRGIEILELEMKEHGIQFKNK